MKKVKLGDVCKLQGGYAFKSNEFQKNSIPIIRIGNIQDDEIQIDYNLCYTEEFLNKHPEFEIQYGDILIAMSGATVGKVGKYQNDSKALLNQRVGKFIVTEKLEKRYLYFLLCSPLFEKYILNNAFGCAQPNISGKKIEEFEFYNYENEDQIEIANKLDKIQEIIDIRKMQIEELEELIKAQFAKMFIKNNFNNVTTVENVCNKLKIGPFGSALHKNEISEDGEVFVLGTDNAVDNEFKIYGKRYITNEKYQELIKYTVHPGDIIISMMGTVGRTSIIPNNFKKAIISSHLCYLTPNNKFISSEFLYYTLKYNDTISNQINRQKKGAIMNGLNLKIIKLLEFDLPPIDLQNQFTEFVKKIDKQKFEIQKSLGEMEKLQESSMNKYFG